MIQQNDKFQNEEYDYVVVLHGLTRGIAHMKMLANYISQNNFEVLNIGYPSTTLPISKIVDNIYESIFHITRIGRRIHFVGYSMGGILARILIDKYNFKKLGRVVQIAPPNHGSELVDYIKNSKFFNFIYHRICGPAGQELDTKNALIKQLAYNRIIKYELGVIAGKINYTIPIVSSLLPTDNDGRVSVDSTRLRDMKDHIIINCSHISAPYNKNVQQQTVFFLKEGRFRQQHLDSINPH